MQDRMLGAKFAVRAVDLLKADKGGRVVGIRNNQIIDDDIAEALAMPRVFNNELYKTATILGS